MLIGCLELVLLSLAVGSRKFKVYGQSTETIWQSKFKVPLKGKMLITIDPYNITFVRLPKFNSKYYHYLYVPNLKIPRAFLIIMDELKISIVRIAEI